jgi:hypothetical protein
MLGEFGRILGDFEKEIDVEKGLRMSSAGFSWGGWSASPAFNSKSPSEARITEGIVNADESTRIHVGLSKTCTEVMQF